MGSYSPDIEALRDIESAIMHSSDPTIGQRHIDALVHTVHMLRPPVPGPLHVRARAAVERLGLDGSRLELAVSVFGWGSDEANGSLLGLVRLAWGDGMALGAMDVNGFSQRPDAMVVALEVKAEAI